MKPFKMIALVVVLVPALATVQAKSKKPEKLPAVFRNAQYVYVQAVNGQQFDPQLYPEDRQAIADVHDALREWNRYTLTMQRKDADLVIVVHKSRIVGADVGVHAGNNPGQVGIPASGQPRGQTRPGVGVSTQSEAGTPDDLFEVCQINSQGKLSAPIWMHTLAGGLDGPDLPLFAQFRDAVDRDYPAQPANQSKKP